MRSKIETIPEVFIIESLDEMNEEFHQYEGEILLDALRLAGKNPKYYYFQSVEELNALATLFDASNYRYLHVSSHGDTDVVQIGDTALTYDEFFLPFTGKLQSKRLFVSACLLGNTDFAEAAVDTNSEISSIIAPCDSISFDVAMAFWVSFYVGCFNEREDRISNDTIMEKVMDLGRVFDEDFFVAINNNGNLRTNTVEDGSISQNSAWVKSFARDLAGIKLKGNPRC